MRHLRSAALAALVLGTLITSAGTALAAPPGNDTYSGRTVVGAAIPFTDSLDTTEATADSDDLSTDFCGTPAPIPTNNSVWYEITPTADGMLGADMSQSTYSAAAIVATGSPGNWSLVVCGFNGLTWTATAGTTYTLLVFDALFEGGGGTLNLTIDVVPPPPTVDITVNPIATFNSQTGSATVSGTATCTGEPGSGFVTTTLTQQAGRFIVRGSGFSPDFQCDGTTRSWSLEVPPDGSKFAGGKAESVTNAFVCGSFGCGFDSEERTIQLRGRA
ncbi:DUF6299 family protein [Kribbella sp. NPDC050124]|uniref:DUF6299 family protein n=1 Tax=Kribbella sp. NPDC050124 TaxID=3364114 RepID=UPI003787F4B1